MSEKKRGLAQPNHLIQGFKEAVGAAGLVDLKCDGYPFTWDNGREGADHVEVKLDRCMVNNTWKQYFNQASASVLNLSTSDHLPIILNLRVFVPKGQLHLFRFENSWVKEPECYALVDSCWREAEGGDLVQKLLSVSNSLDNWGKTFRTKFNQEFDDCRKKMKLLRGERRREDRQEFIMAKERYGTLLMQHEAYWKQRAKTDWLKDGNRNTKFFHSRASERRRKNIITRLQGETGIWKDWDSGLPNLITDYFSILYSSQGCNTHPFLCYMPTVVSEEDNNDLMAPFVAEGIKKTVFSTGRDKSPGIDGLNSGFFQRFWSIIGSEVSQFCISCINNGVIPKKNTPESMKDLRPIALCQVLYKIIAKMLANRMKPVLLSIISPQQSAFVAGRQIQDNSIIAYEVLHHMRSKRYGSTWVAALKIDISKAYNRLEWGFLKDVMLQMGFSPVWTNLIMNCVSSV